MWVKDVILEDLDEIFELEKKNFNQDAFSKEILRSLIKRNTLFLKIVDQNNKIIGFSIALQDAIERINIINFLIDKPYQAKGYGSQLLEATLDKIRKFTYVKKIILNVNTENELAQKLYLKFNFEVIEKLDNYYRAKENAYLMELNL